MRQNAGVLLATLACFSGWLSAADSDGLKYYEAKVRPLLAAQCYTCHSDAAKKVKGDLKLDTKAAILKGGSSGVVLVAGEPDKSPLVQAVRRNHADVAAMPPDMELKNDDVAVLVEWVSRGAPLPDDVADSTRKKETVQQAKTRWPFTTVPGRVPVPAVKDTNWPKNEIDRFILAKLEAKSLHPVGDADKRSLIRRATFDLTGLPPAAADVQSFLNDDKPTAFETVLDRLLASPQYGERWGRHWLDVVRYADTAGDNADFPIPQMYLYRNWVIDAINRDLPYDQFVKEQLAGDLLGGSTEAERRQRTIATGYIANARRFGSRVDDYPTHLTLEDTLDNFGRAFLGLTINCARCHDHKFDPISMQDYYGLYGIFNSTRYPWPGIELEQRQRDLVPLVPTEHVTEVLAEREKKNKEFENTLKTLYAEKGKAPDKEKDAIQKKIDAVKKDQRQVVNAALPFPVAYAVAEGTKRESVSIQLKGDPTKPGAAAPRGFLQVLGGQVLPKDDSGSGRLALANWVIAPDNPLTARVFVNRVWHHHFGRGLVPTPNDFGKQGTAPSHPELLDFLARQFMQQGWSVKGLHKAILLSRAYQLASTGDVPGADTADPNNELLWRFRLRRLDAEAIRDSLLSHGGKLDATMGRAHPFPEATTWNFTQHNPFRAVYDTNRRSVYLMTQRIQRHPYLAIFDGPDPSASTGSRVTSTTALQSLYFLNDAFVHEQAKGFAAQLQIDAKTPEARIGMAYERLYARPATSEETERSVRYIEQATAWTDQNTSWESFVRSLFRLNEFVYIK